MLYPNGPESEVWQANTLYVISLIYFSHQTSIESDLLSPLRSVSKINPAVDLGSFWWSFVWYIRYLSTLKHVYTIRYPKNEELTASGQHCDDWKHTTIHRCLRKVPISGQRGRWNEVDLNSHLPQWWKDRRPMRSASPLPDWATEALVKI